jgi:membrane dipeptidase
MIGLEGLDALVRGPDDLDRLPPLFERGVRVFQPVSTADNLLAGASIAGDDRGLSDLGRAFLQTLFDLGGEASGPRPLLDLANLSSVAVAEVLDWLEADPLRPCRVFPISSRGAPGRDDGPWPRGLTSDSLRRLRALGGVVGFSVGPPFYPDAEALRAGIEAAAAVPFRGRAGFEGIAIGTGFPDVDVVLPGLDNAAAVVAWLAANFDPAAAAALIHGNARSLIVRSLKPEVAG